MFLYHSTNRLFGVFDNVTEAKDEQDADSHAAQPPSSRGYELFDLSEMQPVQVAARSL